MADLTKDELVAYLNAKLASCERTWAESDKVARATGSYAIQRVHTDIKLKVALRWEVYKEILELQGYHVTNDITDIDVR